MISIIATNSTTIVTTAATTIFITIVIAYDNY